MVVPALDEEGSVGRVVTALLGQRVEWVIVVDNGSADATGAVAAASGARVVKEPRRGYGYACAAGANEAHHLGAEIVVFIDADYSSIPEELPRLVGPITSGEADLVLGSRALGHIAPGAMLPHQRFGNWFSSWLVRRLYRIEVTDSGPYRAIRSDVLESLQMREMTFGWPTEMLVKAVRRGARIIERPVSWHVRREGRSKVSGTLRGSILAGYHILRVTFRYARAGRR